MLTLNTDENRSLQFEVTLQGIDHKKLNGSLKFVVEGVEYGFPVELLSDHISVEVPPLDDIIKMGLKEGEIIDCKLDVFGEGFYLNPWKGQFKLKTPVRMEARMTADDGVLAYKPEPFDKVTAEKKIAKSLTVTLKDENGVQEKHIGEQNEDDPLEDEKTEPEITPVKQSEKEAQDDADEEMKSNKRDRSKRESSNMINKEEILEMLQTILERKESKKISKPLKRKKVRESKAKEVSQSLPGRKKKMVSVTSKTGKTYMVTEATAAKLEQLSKRKPPKKKVKVASKKVVNIDETDPRRLMESVGMKNANIQKIMMEKAEELGGDEPSAQIEALKRLLGLNKQDNVVDEMSRVHDSIRLARKE